jgi:hypothetical protein
MTDAPPAIKVLNSKRFGSGLTWSSLSQNHNHNNDGKNPPARTIIVVLIFKRLKNIGTKLI